MTLYGYLKNLFNAIFNITPATPVNEDVSVPPISVGPPISTGRKPIPRSLRNQVWIKYNGDSDIGRCYTCNNLVNRYNYGWHCSHVISVASGGKNVLENLRVCCPKCNLSMGVCNLEEYRIRINK